MKHALTATLFAIALSGCGPRGVKVETVTVVKEVMRPCPVDIPARPAMVKAGDLPANAVDALRIVSIALARWQSPGGFGDQADSALRICTAP